MKTKAIFVALITLLAICSPGPARARGGYHHGHGHHNGAALALGIVGAVIGTAILVDALTAPHYVAPPPPPYYPPPVVYAPPPPVSYRYAPRPYYPPPRAHAYRRGYESGWRDGQRYEAWTRTTDPGPYYPRRAVAR